MRESGRPRMPLMTGTVLTWAALVSIMTTPIATSFPGPDRTELLGISRHVFDEFISAPPSSSQLRLKGRKMLQGASQAGAGAGAGGSTSQAGVAAALSAAAGIQSGGNTESGNGGSGSNDGTLQGGVSSSEWEQSGSHTPPTPQGTVSAVAANLAALGFAVIEIPEDIPAPSNYDMQPRFDEGLTKEEYNDLIDNHEIFKNGTTTNLTPAQQAKARAPAPNPSQDTIIIEVSPGRFVDTGIPRDQLVTATNLTSQIVQGPPTGG